ncbi:MAG: hypothetical protein INQ03_05855 [Candidatus Heimdallarchaeota archaeon]|nr:hypothetical protein [Candidatus Heimdallarchaeota archaeon]
MKRIENVLIIYSWILFGLLIAQVVTNELNLISLDPRSLSMIPIYSKIFLIAFAIWGIMVVIFTFLMELKEGYHLNYLPGSIPKIFVAGSGLLLLGMITILFQSVYNPFKGETTEIWIFFISMHLNLVGIIMVNSAVIWDPYALLPITRAVNHLLHTEQISISLISFERLGPAPLYSKGFHFVDSENNDLDQFLIKLGAIGTSALGMGDQYIEGSAVVPVPNQPNLTALFLSSFVKDKLQPDPRFNGQNYIVLLIIVPSEVRWIIDKREILSERFIQRARKVKDLREEFEPERFVELVKRGLLELAISV